jgi:hypothetical protein
MWHGGEKKVLNCGFFNKDMGKVLRKFCFFVDFFGFLEKVFPNVLYYKKKCDIITMANCPLAFVKGAGEHPRGTVRRERRLGCCF